MTVWARLFFCARSARITPSQHKRFVYIAARAVQNRRLLRPRRGNEQQCAFPVWIVFAVSQTSLLRYLRLQSEAVMTRTGNCPTALRLLQRELMMRDLEKLTLDLQL